jgi:hypothetical protein
MVRNLLTLRLIKDEVPTSPRESARNPRVASRSSLNALWTGSE